MKVTDIIIRERHFNKQFNCEIMKRRNFATQNFTETLFFCLQK